MLTATAGDATRTWDVDATDAVTTFTTSAPKATVSQPGADDARVHLQGPVLDEADGHRRQAGLRRARVPRRRRRLAELLRLADRRQRAVPVQRHRHRHRRCSSTASSPTGTTSSSTGRSTPRATSPTAEEVRGHLPRPGEASDVGTDGGTVPATLCLTLGATPPRSARSPRAMAKDYTAGMAADVVSTAGDAALSCGRQRRRHRPPGQRHVRPAQRAAGQRACPPDRRRAAPAATLLTYSGPSPMTR